MAAPVLRAVDIPPATIREALVLERDELRRFIDVARVVPGECWSEVISGSAQTVHDLVAQVAGSYAAQAHLAELRRQIDPRMLRLYHREGESLRETVARVQIGDRFSRSPDELIRELDGAAPTAIAHREWLFTPIGAVARLIPAGARLPALPLAPFAAAHDLWYHRLDLSEAAGLEITVDSRHDHRILELLVRAAAPGADHAAGGQRIDLESTSAAGGRWRFGFGDAPDALVTIDPIALAKHLDHRRSPAATRERAAIDGDVRAAMRVLAAMQGT